MKKGKFLVTKKIICTEFVSVEANSKTEALELVKRGEGDSSLPLNVDVLGPTDEDNWEVELVSFKLPMPKEDLERLKE